MVINVCDIILSHLDFVNEELTNLFKVIVWRTTQKNEFTTQKVEITTQKKILAYFKAHPKAMRAEAAQEIGDITENGVKFVIAKLQRAGLLKRVGGRKSGEWVVTGTII